MIMYNRGGKMEKHLLVSVSPYVHKYYFNEIYSDLPKDIKETLRAKLGVIAEKVNCIISLGFKESGEIYIELETNDPMQYDDIGAELEIKKFQSEEVELLRALKMWYVIYKTPNGEILRDVMLMQSQKKTSEQIVEEVVQKHGETYREFVKVLVED